MSHHQIIDANLNRAAEGLRVIEDFVRFVLSDADLSKQLAHVRHQIGASESHPTENLLSRHTQTDARAQDPPRPRCSDIDRLKANFKRAEEALRVLEEYTTEGPYNQLRYALYDLEKDVLLRAMKPLIKPGIYLISHDPDILKKGVEWGVSLIQLRDKDADKSQILAKAEAVKSFLGPDAPPFIINDYLDIAQLVDADGLHTGQDDLPINRIRDLLGDHKLIGRTTHSLDQGKAAQAEGADYISVGPIWDTPSKPGRPGIGFDYLQAAQTEITVPYVAIGGISKATIQDIKSLNPPLIGLIRDYENIPAFQNL